jgi:hypothetical protein
MLQRRLLHVGNLLAGSLRLLDALGPYGIDAAEEIVHRHVLDVHVRQWHDLFS